MKKLLFIGLAIITITMTSCDSKTLKECKKVYKQQETFVANCSDCEELENFYITTGEQWGWEDYASFLKVHNPANVDLNTLETLKVKEQDALKQRHNTLKNVVNEKLKSIGCNSPALQMYENTMIAKKMIVEYLSKTLDDFSSYEIVEFGTLDSITDWVQYLDCRQQLNELAIKYAKMAENSLSGFYGNAMYRNQTGMFCDIMESSKYAGAGKELLKLRDELDRDAKKDREEMIHHLLGWSIRHKFRSKNKVGGMVMNDVYFYFNDDFSQMLDRDDIYLNVEKMINE